MPAYLDELRANWRPLAAATLGMSCGSSILSYVASIVAPHMLSEFGWSKSAFAAVGSLGIVALLFFPFVGRLTDVIGVRRTAMIGVVFFPIAYVLLSLQPGSLRFYIVMVIVMGALCITTTATVYSRIVVQHIRDARGLALAIAASGPAVFGLLLAPLFNDFVDAHGWRAGYVLMAVYSAIAGTATLLLMPPERAAATGSPPRAGSARRDYAEIFRSRAFWILAAAMLLCNLPQVLALTQLNLMLLDRGIAAAEVSGLISMFAMGTLAGRFVCGVALDRLPPKLVATVGMALSAIGLFLIAAGPPGFAVAAPALLMIGLSFGAEGDLIGFLVVRAFGVRIYSTVMGMMTAIISMASAIGAILLSIVLKQSGGFAPYLMICGTTVAIGSLLFLVLPRPAVATAAD